MLNIFLKTRITLCYRSIKFKSDTRGLNMSGTEENNLLRLVFEKAILSIKPPDLVEKELKVIGNKLFVRDHEYTLNNNCYIVGFGKCVLSMATKTEKILGEHLKSGILSIPEGVLNESKLSTNYTNESVIKIYEGAKNNLPDSNSMFAAKQIKSLAENLNKEDILLVAISGGGSALLPLPISPITLDEELQIIKLLVSSGADIMELNSVRKRISVLKGGGLSEVAYPASVITFILSDVIGDHLDCIASGPTVTNLDPVDLAWNILNKYSLTDKIPESIKTVLKKELNHSNNTEHVQNILIGNNVIALTHAANEVHSKGYKAIVLSSSVDGLVTEVCDLYINVLLSICQLLSETGSSHSHKARNSLKNSFKKLKVSDSLSEQSINEIIQNKFKNIFLLFGGETTVKINGTGLGGRNQELALRFSIKLNEMEKNIPLLKNFKVSFLSAGTDGIDGPTDAAGAIAYSGQMDAAIQQNLSPQSYVDNNDSYNFFCKLNKGDDLIKTGHTGVNVMDLQFLSIEIKQ
uniref:Glycerate kinase n=1 Tax=Clastoptera arizonana TaxID=38151 RepID=A0A1B6EA41_9HEMI